MMAETGESPEFIQKTINALRSKEKDYQANARVYASLGNRSMIAIAGPTGSGKTTVTSEVIRLDSDFREVETTTTRPHRDGDPAGFQTGVSYADFYEGVNAGEFVNYTVIGQNAYGTYESGFPGTHNIGPIMSKSVIQMLESGFKNIDVVYMLVEEAEYERRLRQERMHFSDFKPRLDEAEESRNFVYAHKNERWLHFVESSASDERATKAASKIINIVNHNSGEFMTVDHALKLLDGMQNALHRVADDLH